MLFFVIFPIVPSEWTVHTFHPRMCDANVAEWMDRATPHKLHKHTEAMQALDSKALYEPFKSLYKPFQKSVLEVSFKTF